MNEHEQGEQEEENKTDQKWELQSHVHDVFRGEWRQRERSRSDHFFRNTF